MRLKLKIDDVPPVVIYHASCNDGFCAAWLANLQWPDAKFVEAQHGDGPPWFEAGRPVIIVDFSYDRQTLIDLHNHAGGNLIVLDHHKSSEANCGGLDFCEFDTTRCGAAMMWDYIRDHVHADTLSGWSRTDWVEGRHWLVAYVQDRDLWQWKLPMSREVNAAINLVGRDFNQWSRLAAYDLANLMSDGASVTQAYRIQIDSHKRHAHMALIGGRWVPAVACTCKELISDIAGELSEGNPFAACYFDVLGKGRVFSLRTRRDDVDVSEIAGWYGGGGHQKAAGCTVRPGQFEFRAMDTVNR